MCLAPTCHVANVRPSRNSPYRAVILRQMPEYQCHWFRFYRASNFYCMPTSAELSSPSGLPLAADRVAVSVAAALEMTRHAPGAVRQAGGDKLRCCHAPTCSGGGSGDQDDEDRTDRDHDNADGDDVNPDNWDGRPCDRPCAHPSTVPESLYPRKGHCHAFVAGPNKAAVLDVLFASYNEDDGRECTY
jgi:hypothetical protein